MGRSTFLFITLTASSLGCIIQISHSLEYSDTVGIAKSTSKHSSPAEVILLSDGSSDSVESSGQTADSMAPQTLINQTVGPKESERAGNKNRSGSGTILTPTPALTPHVSETRDRGADKANISITGYIHASVHIISEEALLDGSHVATEERLKRRHESIVKDDFLDGSYSPKLSVQNNVFTSTVNRNLSGSGGPCSLGLSPCGGLKNFNGTNLLWDDMRRTLAFAWELHVFGSAGLFMLMAVMAAIGAAGACTLPYPICHALTLANALLILSGALRGVLLLLDPYGTCQILSRATLAALHNVPLQLLLWTQVAVTLVTLRGLKFSLLPLKLQHTWMVGGLAISHCIPSLAADLLSPTISPALPLLLQTLSICLAIPLCMGILITSFSHLHPVRRSSIPQWIPSQRIESHAKRVTAVCAFLGALCFSLQMYSLLWLYGLLGNWRRFGWGWWVSQFCARLLELAWGFSLLVLGSWIFWTPSMRHSRSDQGQGRGEASKGVERTSVWDRVLANIQRGPLRKSEKTWEELMPSNWAKYNLSRTGFSRNVMCPYDNQPSTITPEYKPDPVSNSSSDSQTTLLWQKVGERECVLSLIEFDMRPLSPINLRRSIDDALHHGQLVAGLFTPPPAPWTESLRTDTTDGDGGAAIIPPTNVGCGGTVDSESVSTFFKAEPIQSPNCAPDHNVAHQEEELNYVHPLGMHQHNWCDDDVTDL